MGAAVQAPEAIELCTATRRTGKKKGQPCQNPAIRDGLCMPHSSAAEAARPEAMKKGWETRRQDSQESRPDTTALRRWVRHQMREHGFGHAKRFSAACGLPGYRIMDFLGQSKQPLLSEASLAALASYTGTPIEELIKLQGGHTMESWRALVGVQNFSGVKGPPAGSAARQAAGAKIHAAHLQSGHYERLWAAGAEARADPERQQAWSKNVSLSASQRLASHKSAPPWQRWVAGKMVDRGMDRRELADRLALKRHSVNQIFQRSNTAPRKTTIQALENILGPMPPEVQRSLKDSRSAKFTGTTKMWARLKMQAQKWKRERLEREIKALGGSALVAELRPRYAHKSYVDPLGLLAYEVYQTARGKVAYERGLAKRRPPPYTRPASSLRAKSRLKYALSGIKRRTHNRFFQCRGCGQIWISRLKQKRYPLCSPCWQEYFKTLNSWRLNGRPGSLPEHRRRSGGRTIDSDDLRQKIIALLRYRALGKGPAADASYEYKMLRDTERRLAASSHAWCQRVTQLLAQLSTPT